MESFVETALGFIWSIFPLIIMLGVLVFVHELGHFAFAKWLGVKVMKFSIGFGPRIVGWTRGETEYVLSWIPLGGYVKMLGENPGEEIVPEDQGRTLSTRPFLQKALIVFAGPGMNLALPVLLFMALYFTGYPDVTTYVGSVERDSVAAEAGIAPGERIVAIDGTPVTWWEDLSEALLASVGKPLRLEIEGADGRREVTVVPKSETVKTLLGDEGEIGAIGITPLYEAATAAVSRTDSPAYEAGLRMSDQIKAVDGRPLTHHPMLGASLQKARGPISIAVERDGKPMDFTLPALGTPEELDGLESAALMERAGFEDPQLFIRNVERHSPAEEAGLLEGDRLVSIDGEALENWEAFTERVIESNGKSLAVTVRRAGVDMTVTVAPGLRFNRDPLAKESKTYYVGVASLARYVPGKVEPRVVRNPIESLAQSVEETWRMCDLVVVGMWKLLTGAVRLDNIGGPIQIGVVAAKAADEGLVTFVRMMAFISINLGILNLLPIPILDGGHLLFFAIEGLKRGPISLRKKELAQQVGLTMLILLIGVAFYNDIARSWNQIVGFLKDVGTGLM
ncbi:MAG: RIP metalloprotease RseP [Deltaproteobacteria bacterium]|nr:RIP metalloprotease RseP [Deltaproteobacteria bacterium]